MNGIYEQAGAFIECLGSENKLKDDLIFAQLERMAGFNGISGDAVADKMDAVIESTD